MKETQLKGLAEKRAAAINIKMLSIDKPAQGKPAEAIIARNVKINVKDLVKTDPNEVQPYSRSHIV